MTDRFDWRAHLPVHPAAELFPPISQAELEALAEDIKAHGLQTWLVKWRNPNPDSTYEALLDGRNRLDALAALGLLTVNDKGQLCQKVFDGESATYELRPLASLCTYRKGDPYKIALSLNMLRRHLTPEQKRDVIAKLLRAQPDQSNLAIAKQVKADDKTVAKVRADLEARSEIPNVAARTDSKGRKQPAKKPAITPLQKAATKSVSPKDAALLSFTEQVCALLQRISNHKPTRFADTAVKAGDLDRLGKFFTELASLKNTEVAS
jgi:hypothetical protein